MKGKSHKLVTEMACNIFLEIYGNDVQLGRHCLVTKKQAIIEASKKIDQFKDLEFVDVEGGIIGSGRDDPHVNNTGPFDDTSSYKKMGHDLTTYNHFIDIRKGTGLYDDYDGYSFYRGSASLGCDGDTSDVVGDTIGNCLDEMSFDYEKVAGADEKNLDRNIMYGINDEYVHATGRKWYRDCSPALGRYSYYNENKSFLSLADELKSRFPLAQSTGEKDMGIPYSVFMPVDNLGRYWYERVILSKSLQHIGTAMHGIQDATVPHHAACYSGRYHRTYEIELNDFIEQTCFESETFKDTVKMFLEQWLKSKTPDPKKLSLKDKSLIPSKNWRIDHLITWLALHAFDSFEHVYQGFLDKKSLVEDNAMTLTALATAMSTLMLVKLKEKMDDEYFELDQRNQVKNIRISHQTSIRKSAGTDDPFHLMLFYNETGGDIDVAFKDFLYDEREPGRYDQYGFNVEQYELNINRLRIALKNRGANGWLPAWIKINVETMDGRKHLFSDINRWPDYKWFDGEGTIAHEIPRKRAIPSHLKVVELTLTHTTSKEEYADTDSGFKLYVSDQLTPQTSILLKNLPYDERERGMTDQYLLNVSEYGDFNLNTLKLGLGILGEDAWLPKSLFVTARTQDGQVHDVVSVPNWSSKKWFDSDKSCRTHKTNYYDLPMLRSELLTISSTNRVQSLWFVAQTSNRRHAETDDRVNLIIKGGKVGDYKVYLGGHLSKGSAYAKQIDTHHLFMDMDELSFEFENEGPNGWLPETVFVIGKMENGDVHTLVNITQWGNQWLESDGYKILNVPRYRSVQSDEAIEKLWVYHTTSTRDYADTDEPFNLRLSQKMVKRFM